MKRFLFLDDTQERHDRFDQICKEENLDVEVWHVYDVKQAIHRLNSVSRFDCAFLDHDLGDVDSTGYTVAKYIALHMKPEFQPENIVIHSWNPGGAEDMEQILREYGYNNVVRVPFRSGPEMEAKMRRYSLVFSIRHEDNWPEEEAYDLWV